MEKRDQIELGVGIVIILIALTAIALSAVAMVKEFQDTDFTSAQVTELKSWTTKMSFDAQNDLVAKGFTTNTNDFLATNGNINAKGLTAEELKIFSIATPANFLSVKDNVLSLTSGTNSTVLSATGLTTEDVTSTTGTCTNLNCGTIQSGTWNGNTIDVAHGGTGITSFAVDQILCGGTTPTGNLQQTLPGTTGQFLISQGPAALPIFVDGPSLIGSSYIPILTNVAANWDVSGPQTEAFYTAINNNYTVYGKIVATNLAISPILVPFSVRFDVPGIGTFADSISLRGNADSVDVTTPSSAVPTSIVSFADVTNRLVQLNMVPVTISGVTTLDSWEFNFICSYRI